MNKVSTDCSWNASVTSEITKQYQQYAALYPSVSTTDFKCNLISRFYRPYYIRF